MIGDICSKPAVTAAPETTVQEAAHRMRTRKVGALVIVNGKGEPTGILTDRDIVVGVVALGQDPAKTQVGALVRRKPTVIREDKGVLDATKLLSKHGIRRLPVVSKEGKLTGIISLDDLLMLLGSELSHIASTLASELGRTKV